MARDNRKENRAKAKEAGNENQDPGETFADLTEEFDSDNEVEEEVVAEEGKDKDKDKGENESDDDKDASKREADAIAATTDANGVDKQKVEEDARKAEEARLAEEAKAKAETPEAKAAREAEEAKKAAPAAKAEPTAEEKAKAEVDAKAAKDAADAEAAAKAKENPQLTDEEAAKLFTDWRSSTETLLAEHVYKLTEDDVAQLNDNPAAYIPKAMARVYLDTISASFQQFVNYLPKMVYQVLEARDIHAKNEGDFFSAWPDLPKDGATKAAILRIGGAYRQTNPTATAEEFINEVGAQAMVALRIQPKTAAQTQVLIEQTPAFKPASTTATSTPQKQTPSNPYDALVREFSVEDMDEN